MRWAGGEVSAVACGEPLSLSHVPTDRVVRIDGPTSDQLAVGLDPVPDGAPVIIRYRVPPVPISARVVVNHILDELEAMARRLFPIWLPDADFGVGSSDFDRRVVRQLAHRMASTTEHFGPFLADLAESALRGQVTPGRFEPEIRARGLAGIIADSYGRDNVVLLVVPSEDPSVGEQQNIATACEWLVARGDLGVWLTSAALPSVDRFPTWFVPVPEFVETLSPPPGDTEAPTLEYPALAGLPHPASDAEQALERSLARCEWAVGRVWNGTYASDSLTPPIRVDLMWPDERCVVEIDGPDHRGILKYAADRRRDNGLVLDGFAVLRFTNDEIGEDPGRVLAVIERLLVNKRHDEGNLA